MLPTILEWEEMPELSGERGDSNTDLRVFEVHVSDPLGAGDAIYQYAPALQRGRPHPKNPDLRVQTQRYRQTHGGQKEGHKGYRFVVQVQYSSSVPDPNFDPLSVPAAVALNFVYQSEIIQRDHEGRLITTTAGQPLPGVEDLVPLPVFSIRKNIPANLPDWITSYPRSMNSDVVTLRGRQLAPKTLQIGRLSVSEVIDANTPYSVLEMDLVHNPKTWVRTLLNQGTMEIRLRENERFRRAIGGTPRRGRRFIRTLEPILDETGAPVEEPVFLDRDGFAIRADVDGERTFSLPDYESVADVRELNPDRVKLKAPLDPEDLIVVEYTLRPPLPYNILPLV